MRHLVLNSFLLTQFSRIVLASGVPFSELLLFMPLPLLARNVVQPRSASHMLRFLLEFLYSSHTVHEFLPNFSSRSPQTPPSSSVSYPRVLPNAPQTRCSSCSSESSGLARVLDARFLLPEHDDVSLADTGTHRSQQSFDVGVQELLVTLPAVSDSFHPRVSFPHVSDCGLRLPTSPSSSPVFP